jgi:hypothetical protein
MIFFVSYFSIWDYRVRGRQEIDIPSDREFAQFITDHPEQIANLQSEKNRYGVPLNPSGMYAYWAWQGKTNVIQSDIARMLCQFLAAKHGQGVKDGSVISWELNPPPKS